MPPQGEVVRQWFLPGEGIDRSVISADIQRYLGNDATVRPGAGNGEYQGVNGYWIKAYRNLTSAMIADLRADSLRWRQEQGRSGQSSYVGSRTYDQSNAAEIQRSSRDSPSLDQYGNPVPGRGMEGRQDPRRPQGDRDPMQIDAGAGRPAQAQGFPPQQGYGYPPDARGQYQQDPRYQGQQNPRDGRQQQQQRPSDYPQEYNPYPSPAATVAGINQGGRDQRDPFPGQQSYVASPPQYDQYGRVIPGQGRPQGYQDQPMVDAYGQPDAYGRYPVNQPTYGQGRDSANYGQPAQGPPPGFSRQGEYYVPNTTGYGQGGMPVTSGPDQASFYPGQPQQQQRGQQNPAYPAYQPQEPEYPPPRTQPAGRQQQPPPSGRDERRRRNG